MVGTKLVPPGIRGSALRAISVATMECCYTWGPVLPNHLEARLQGMMRTCLLGGAQLAVSAVACRERGASNSEAMHNMLCNARQPRTTSMAPSMARVPVPAE